MARKLTVQNAVRNSRRAFLCLSVLALVAGLEVPAAFAQSAQVNPPPTFAPPPTTTATAPATAPAAKQPTTKQTATPATAPVTKQPATKQTATNTATPSTNAAPAAKQNSQPVASVPVPTPKPDAPGAIPAANALPTTNVVASANGGRMLNPYSEQPETKYIKYPVTSNGCKDARAPGKPYFVEFRSRGAQSFGHTFVLFGKLGEGNRFASYKIAGLHPKGDSANYTMGLWIPVPAETGPSDGDVDEQFMTARYCVTLTEAEYNRLVPYIKHLQSEHTTWHGTTYNCNSFGMDVAKFVGLDTPNPNASLPKDLIEKLAQLNKNKPRDMTAGLYSAAGGSQPVRR
jgi:hypothetical protein